MTNDESGTVDAIENDQELLDAIAATFGSDALASLQDEPERVNRQFLDLDAAVRQIDSETFSHTAEEQPTAQGRVHTTATVVFQLEETIYGIPLPHVLEIQRVPAITHLPHLPEWIQGVANLRGNVISVVDLRMLIGLPPTDSTTNSRRFVLVQSLVDEIETGLIVDRVIGIRNLQDSQIGPPTAPIDAAVTKFLHGVIELDKRLVILLDVEKLMLAEEFSRFSDF